MTRRYIQPAVPKSKATRQPSRVSKLSNADLKSLPSFITQGLKIIDQPRSQAKSGASVDRRSIHEPDCEAVFINSRAPGSQSLQYKKSKRQPLMTIDDRLQRVLVISRDEDIFEYQGHKYHYTEWLCRSKYDPDKISYITLVKLLTEPDQKEYLIETPAGRCCPKCKSNEFVRSELKNMPITYQDKHWCDRESFDEFCERCKTITKRS